MTGITLKIVYMIATTKIFFCPCKKKQKGTERPACDFIIVPYSQKKSRVSDKERAMKFSDHNLLNFMTYIKIS